MIILKGINIVKVDMQEELSFEDEKFDLVFANLSIHYFSDEDTKKLMLEIKKDIKRKWIIYRKRKWCSRNRSN